MGVTPVRAIAAAQTIPVRGDVNANVRDHVRLAQAAAEAQAQILVFPEPSLTGYELDLANELACSERDPRLEPLMEVASSYQMTLVVGAPVRLGSRLCIGAFIVSPDTAVGLYTKHHLGAFPASASPDGIVPPAEDSVFQAGTRNPLARFGDHTAAVAVCSDASPASHPQQARDRGVTTYLASAFIIPCDLDRDSERLRSYAVRHSMAVVLANYGGRSGGLPSGRGERDLECGGRAVGPASGDWRRRGGRDRG